MLKGMRQWIEKWRLAWAARQDNPLLQYGRSRQTADPAKSVRSGMFALLLILAAMLLAISVFSGSLSWIFGYSAVGNEWSLLFIALAGYGLYYFSGLSSAVQRALGMLARLPRAGSLLNYSEELALCGLTPQDMLLCLYQLSLPQLLLRILGGLIFLSPLISAYLFFGGAISSPGLLVGTGFGFSLALLIPQIISAVLACLILLNFSVLLGRGMRTRLVVISSAVLLCVYQLCQLQAASQLLGGSSFAYTSPLSAGARHELLLFFFCLGLLLAAGFLRLSLLGTTLRSALALALPALGVLLSATISYLHKLPSYAGSYSMYEEAVRLQLMSGALWLLSWPLPLSLVGTATDPAAGGPSPVVLALLRIAGQLVVLALSVHAAELSLRRSIEED
jgi:hypothetical protein